MITKTIRRYFISGLLVWLPIWITILVIKFLVDILNDTMLLLPPRYHPDTLLGVHIPGIGVITTLLVIFLTGAFVANYLGSRLIDLWDAMINRIPLVRSIYMSVKQVVETLFTPGGQSFRKVLLVEFPKKGLWSIAFQTGDSVPEIAASKKIEETEMISIFIPLTPNPTSGYLMLVERKKIIELNMSVDQALKYILSLGVVPPIIKNNHK